MMASKDNSGKPDSTAPSCPACGHTVFNKRYPNCEFCGATLPEGLVLSPEKRKLVFEEDRKQSDADWQTRQRLEKANSKKKKADSFVYLDSSYSDGGDCGGHDGGGGGHC